MAPAKKSKSVSKRVAVVYDVSPSKGVGVLKKSKQKKPKLADMLGPQWSKQELQRFYEGYRKYGSDWKKVANIVRNRSSEMVEALYSMNRAYLSLPEGTASVVGLIAMMTDHYSNLGGNGNEADDDYLGISKSPQKCTSRANHVGLPQEQLLQSLSSRQTDNCLSLLKRGMQLYVPVRKRTPRVPIPALERKYNETQRQIGSSQFSLTTYGTEEDSKRAHVSMGKQMLSKSDLMQDKYHGIKMDYGSPAGYEGPSKRVNIESSSHQAVKKRSKKLVTEDESLACDALQVLADLSLALSASTAEPVESSRESANGGETTIDSTALSDGTLVSVNANAGSKKKKQKTSKTAEKRSDLQPGRPIEEKALAEEDSKSGNMFNEHNQAHADIKHCKVAGSSDVTSIIDQEMAEVDIVVSSRQNPSKDHVVLPSKRKSCREQEWPLIRNGVKDKDSLNSSKELLNKHPSFLPETTPYLKLQDKLSRCLSSPLLRRWCGFEWFYSAIDYPWFADKEFIEYLNHVGLAHIPRLTRVEWGVIRSSLGKPRRFSKHFLKEEREKLERYRESVRKHYSELHAGIREGLPTDLARPLSVGQRVIAIHPKTLEFHEGSILTVNHDKFRVQFDRAELGVEFVMDINCMPCNQLENMPESMRRQKVSIDYGNSKERFADGRSILACRENMPSLNAWTGSSTLSHVAVNHAKVDSTSVSLLSKAGASNHLKTSSTMIVEGCTFQMQPREGDNQHTVHLNNSVDRKALPFLVCPEQGRYCPGNLLHGTQPTANVAGTGGVLRSIGDREDLAPKVAEIVRDSREKAHKMIDAAIQAISSLKEGENAYARIAEALDSINKLQRPSESGSPIIPSPSPTNGSLNAQNEVKVCISENSLTNNSCDGVSKTEDLKFPSDLITSCVATLLMIQTCTDRQYPPTEVAHLLDNAISSMHPCCPQNLPVYREIEMCMGKIKTQILALIPS